MLGKKGRIIFWSIIILIIIVGFLIFVFNGDKCKFIDDEDLFKRCELCEDEETEIVCRDNVYQEYAFLKSDLELCNKLVLEHRKQDCISSFETSFARGGERFVYEPNGVGGFERIE